MNRLAYFAMRVQIAAEDVVSAHEGRHIHLLEQIKRNRYVYAVFPGAVPVRQMAAQITDYALQIRMYLGTELGGDAEQIESGDAADFLEYTRRGAVCCIFENQGMKDGFDELLEDEALVWGDGSRLYEEVRAVVIRKLRLFSDAVVYDIGSGCGTIALEAAVKLPEGEVYAVEKEKAAVALLKENKKRCAAGNVIVVEGTAPSALLPLPRPTHVFLDGGCAGLRQILETVLKKNPYARVVMTSVTVEAAAKAVEVLRTLGKEADIVTVHVTEVENAGGEHVMRAQDPVTIYTF